MRTALYMAALSAKGYKSANQKPRAGGKPAKVALIAIARQILLAANSVLRQDRPWTPKNA